MERSGIADKIRAEDGNLRYEYFFPMNDPETVLLIDAWRDQAALDAHHASPMMGQIASLRDKYDLHMRVERFINVEENESDGRYIWLRIITRERDYNLYCSFYHKNQSVSK